MWSYFKLYMFQYVLSPNSDHKKQKHLNMLLCERICCLKIFVNPEKGQMWLNDSFTTLGNKQTKLFPKSWSRT